MDIIIFGAGNLGKAYLRKYKYDRNNGGGRVLAITANNYESLGSSIESIPIIAPQEIHQFLFDKIVIATTNGVYITQIMQQLVDYGVSKEKIEVLSDLDFNPYNENTDNRVIWLRNFAQYIYRKNIIGNVAECGVYRGWFSRYINIYFCDRKLYLFDTFCGFDENDLEDERKRLNNCLLDSHFVNDPDIFKNAEIECVMRQMAYPENCIVKKGVFPQTTIDINDFFCFVNLDMDLYKPMLAALKFFWSRMTQGGIILLHDYFTSNLPGVELAVADFEQNLQRKICMTPIGDFSSIALIKD